MNTTEKTQEISEQVVSFDGEEYRVGDYIQVTSADSTEENPSWSIFMIHNIPDREERAHIYEVPEDTMIVCSLLTTKRNPPTSGIQMLSLEILKSMNCDLLKVDPAYILLAHDLDKTSPFNPFWDEFLKEVNDPAQQGDTTNV